MQERKFFEHLSACPVLPAGDALKGWLVSAEKDGLHLLTEEEHDDVILYASFQNLLIISIFAQAANLASLDKDKLSNSSFYVDETWRIQKAWGGGQGHRQLQKSRAVPAVDYMKNAIGTI
jgi:hypothetical protein